MSEEKTENHALDTFRKSRLVVLAHVAFYTVSVIAVLAGIGYLLDQQFGTFPKIFIGSLIVGYPLAQVILFKKIRALAKSRLNKE